ncbi:MAG: glycosyltransferase [Dermatophilaceae bacterium]|nr:glycosyltransferase [Actinomycetales bacterium]MBP8881386.1 glycosyltransferase [Dermatophilaceae bacterium]MBP9918365.1 glycosyltransferase [Dermatophilaceae bacterium]
MRIAMLTDCYLPRLGGIEVQVHDLSQRLVARGHEVEVFTATPGAEGQRWGAVETVDGIPVHRLAIPLPTGLPVNPLAPLTLRKHLRRFDAVHVHMGVVSPFAVDCAALAHRMRVPAVMTWHCVLDRAEPVVNRIGVVRRWAQSGMAMNAVSAMAAEPVCRIVDGPVVNVLPNGIDTAQWRCPPRPLLDDPQTRFVTAMRFAPRKRPIQLLEMMSRVRAAAPKVDVRLEIFGDGPKRAEVERAIERLGASGWVTLAGRVSREQLLARYAVSDVYVSPAELESFGIAALEARTVGLPVVARQGTGISEFITDEVNGYLAPSDDEMVRDLTKLAIHQSLRARMAAYNRANPPAQDWDNVVALAESEYARAVAARSVTA